MAEELGKIEKPAVDQFKGTRKLYIVPLVFTDEEAPFEYQEKCFKFWEQVEEQIAGQEAKVGKVTRIFFESISYSGEEGLKLVEKFSAAGHRIVKGKVDAGAVFEATETRELFNENMDWQRCLLLGFYSQKVADVVSEGYRQSTKQRYEHISKHIAETLKPGEVALLFIHEGHSVQFPEDIDVFSVSPPALDEINRWLRDQRLVAEKEAAKESEKDKEKQESSSEKKEA